MRGNRAIVSRLLTPYVRTKQGNKEALGGDLGGVIAVRSFKSYAIFTLFFAGITGGKFGLVWAIPVCVLGVLGAFCYIDRQAKKRRSAIERDLPALLTSVASSVRAGIDPLRAIADSDQYLPKESPLSEEARLFKARLRTGEDEFSAIESFLSSDTQAEVELFKRCVILSRQHGSSLAEPLHRVVRVVRQNQSFKRKTRAALAMHRMSAVGIALCAALIAIMQGVMNAKGVALAFTKTSGITLLSLGGALILSGVCWMLSMGREERL